MSDKELDVFLAHIALHPEIQPSINACRERVKAVRAVSQAAATNSFRKWPWLIAILLGSIGSTWFFLHETTENLPGPVPAVPQTSPPPSFPKQEPMAQVQDTLHDPPKAHTKLLATNYRPNEYLEMHVNGGMRGEALEFTVESPLPDAHFRLQSGTVNFNLSGTVKQKKAETPGSFQVFIFDNQQVNVEAMRFLASAKLPIISKANGINSFQLTQKINLGRGLFYFIIEDANGDWQFVGRFSVK